MTTEQYETLSLISSNQSNPGFSILKGNRHYEIAQKLAAMNYVSNGPEFHLTEKGKKAIEHYISGRQRDILADFDLILPGMLSSNGVYFGNEVFFEIDPHCQLRDQLMADGFLVQDPINKYKFTLTTAGRYFIMKGGFKAEYERLQKIDILNEEQLRTSIETNRSVKRVNRWFYLTIFVAAAGVVFQAASLIKDNAKDDLRERMQMQEQRVLRIESQLSKEKSLPPVQPIPKDSSAP